MERRRLLRSLLLLFSSAASASLIYPLVRFLEPPGADAKGKVTSVRKSEVAVGSAKDILVNNTPALLLNIPDKGFVAVSKVCTHLGCLVEYDREKKRLLCPCHAGVYGLEGNVVSGPPPKPLLKFPVRVQGEEVLIG